MLFSVLNPRLWIMKKWVISALVVTLVLNVGIIVYPYVRSYLYPYGLKLAGYEIDDKYVPVPESIRKEGGLFCNAKLQTNDRAGCDWCPGILYDAKCYMKP